ncbi:MAG: TerB family tellurite resistance protein [Labilithrix sp.]|nr:TerB family tellurite resistance protein [Labilithrix sp.]MBX3221310.1 TerB family tellurite resistance protein [Labilithrix sp.]
MRDIVAAAIDQLCVAFERGGYNPTPIIDLGVLVVIADGVVDDKEREVLLDLFQTLLDTKLSPEVVDHLVTASVQVVEAAGAESRARLIAEILLDCDAVEPGILVALAVAYASEGLSKEERVVIERIADAAELPRARLDQLISRVRLRADGGDPMSVRSLLAAGPPSSP